MKDLHDKLQLRVRSLLDQHKIAPPESTINLVVEISTNEVGRYDIPVMNDREKAVYMAGFTAGATALLMNLQGMADDGSLIFKENS